MPRVRMLTSLATVRHSWRAGELVQASAAEAQSWLAAGIAELVAPEAPVTPEARQGRPETRHRSRNGRR